VVKRFLPVAAVLALDVATKHLFVAAAWTNHYQPRSWQISAVLALLIPLALIFYRPAALGAALLLAGVLGNLLDSLAGGGVRNPFVVGAHGGSLAFNVADVSLVLGGLAVVAAMPLLAYDLAHRLRRRREFA
jgi:hypothetical protein